MQSQTVNKYIDFSVVNSAGTTLIPLIIRSNGVIDVSNSNSTVNKMLVLYDFAPSGSVSATNFYGFGINGGTLRYQASATSDTHKFYCGATLGYTINSAGGQAGSDARWKTEVQPITGALAKVSQLQGRTFVMNGEPERKMGFIAQEVKEVVPEVIWVDKSTPEEYHFMQYDRLTALLCEGIKELLGKVTALEARVAALEGNPS